MPFNLEESYVAVAEQAFGARLPESYRLAMQRANGGEIEAAGDTWQLHPIEDTSNTKRLSRTSNHILKETAVCHGWSGFPAEAIAIAENGAGDRLVFVERNGVFEPFVHSWSHETRTLSKVADDFAELKAP